jgi:hypothetical protein
MMSETVCTYPDRDELLVSYLYNDIDSAERLSFGSHLSTCRQCQEDLTALGGVRTTLSAWAPPEPSFSTRGSRAPSPEPRAPRWWHDVPAWAQVAAALFVLGISATIANLDVRYDRSGLTIRTGWSKVQAADSTALRGELAAVEGRLRAKIDANSETVSAVKTAAAQTPTLSETELRRRVDILLDEREKRIQREIALAVAGVMQDYQQQRTADLANIDRTLGFIRTNNLSEQLKQREAVNYLLKVSQTR